MSALKASSSISASRTICLISIWASIALTRASPEIEFIISSIRSPAIPRPPPVVPRQLLDHLAILHVLGRARVPVAVDGPAHGLLILLFRFLGLHGPRAQSSRSSSALITQPSFHAVVVDYVLAPGCRRVRLQVAPVHPVIRFGTTDLTPIDIHLAPMVGETPRVFGAQRPGQWMLAGTLSPTLVRLAFLACYRLLGRFCIVLRRDFFAFIAFHTGRISVT